MKKLLVFVLGFSLVASVKLCAQVVTENFQVGAADGVKDLSPNEEIGHFNFVAFNEGELVNDGMILTQFQGKSSLMLGLSSKVTELRIIGKAGSEFRLVGFEALTNYLSPSSDNKISVTGYKEGLQITQPIALDIKEVFGPGEFYNFQDYPDFAQVDEIRLKAKKLELSIEQLVYEMSDGAPKPYMATR